MYKILYVWPILRGVSHRDPQHQRRGKVFLQIQGKEWGKIQITADFVIEYTVRGQSMGFRPGIRPTHTNLHARCYNESFTLFEIVHPKELNQPVVMHTVYGNFRLAAMDTCYISS